MQVLFTVPARWQLQHTVHGAVHTHFTNFFWNCWHMSAARLCVNALQLPRAVP
jgi:hypothetical protein